MTDDMTAPERAANDDWYGRSLRDPEPDGTASAADLHMDFFDELNAWEESEDDE